MIKTLTFFAMYTQLIDVGTDLWYSEYNTPKLLTEKATAKSIHFTLTQVKDSAKTSCVNISPVFSGNWLIFTDETQTQMLITKSAFQFHCKFKLVDNNKALS